MAAPAAAAVLQRRVVALTQDPTLARALEELAALNVPVVQAASLELLAEQLVEAGAAIALLDAGALDRPVDALVDRLITQFPDLRIIVAGHGLEQNVLATRIAQGTVFRFVHKPASAQRLKLFVDAANRSAGDTVRTPVLQMPERPRESVARLAASAPASAGAGGAGPRLPLPLPALIGGGVALVALIVGGILLFGRGKHAAPAASSPAPAVAAAAGGAPATSAAVDTLIQSADQAFAAQRFAGRDGNSAAELYQKAAQAAPQDTRARSGLARSIDFALRNAESAFTEGRYAEAEATIGALQALAPGNSRLAFLTTQLQRERERTAAEEKSRSTAESRQEKLRVALSQVNERLRRGALVEPERDSAYEALLTAQDLAPGDSDVRALRERLDTRLLEAATQRLDAGDVNAARGLLDAAGSLGADAAVLTRLRRRADELRSAAAAAANRDVRTDAAAASAPAPTPAPAATTPQQPAAAATATATTPPAATAGTLRIYAPSELTLVRKSEVDYPERALQQKISGWAEVEFTITTDGAVRNVIVLNSEPKGLFDQNVMSALRKWRYKPVMENGKAVEARSRVRLRFTPAAN